MNLQILTEPISEVGTTRLLVDIVRDVVSDKAINKDYEEINNNINKIAGTKLSTTKHVKRCDELFRVNKLLRINRLKYNYKSLEEFRREQEGKYRNALDKFIEDHVRKDINETELPHSRQRKLRALKGL